MSDLIERSDVIKALRLEYPMMPLFKSLREEWAIKTEGYRKAEEVIMKLPSVDTPTTMTGVIDAIREAEYRGYMKAVKDRPKGKWVDAEIPLESGGSMPIQVCNLCKTFYPLAYTGGGHRFCPNCGARMLAKDTNVPNKKGADDE